MKILKMEDIYTEALKVEEKLGGIFKAEEILLASLAVVEKEGIIKSLIRIDTILMDVIYTLLRYQRYTLSKVEGNPCSFSTLGQTAYKEMRSILLSIVVGRMEFPEFEDFEILEYFGGYTFAFDYIQYDEFKKAEEVMCKIFAELKDDDVSSDFLAESIRLLFVGKAPLSHYNGESILRQCFEEGIITSEKFVQEPGKILRLERAISKVIEYQLFYIDEAFKNFPLLMEGNYPVETILVD